MTIPEEVREAIAWAIFGMMTPARHTADSILQELQKLPLPARLALASALAGPEHAVVPKEPTDFMTCVGDEEIIEALEDHSFALRPDTPAKKCYRAMVAGYANIERGLAAAYPLTASQAQEGERDNG